MKPEHHIETILMNASSPTLPAAEKDAIKASLLQYATSTLPAPAQAVISPFQIWLTRSAMVCASVCLLFVGTAYASHDSLPGEPLYAVKINVVEEMIERTKITPSAKLAYDLERMEIRLLELKTLESRVVALSPADIAVLTDQINEHVADVTTTLDDKETVTADEKIATLTKLSGLTAAQVQIADEIEGFEAGADTIAGADTATNEVLTEVVTTFLATEESTVVNSYLSDQIDDIETYLTASSTEATDRERVEDHLYDVVEALQNNNPADAIESIIDAQQERHLDTYLESIDATSTDNTSSTTA